MPLVNLYSCRFAGPVLALSLQYSPISLSNEGFGTGFSLNLTRYDTTTGKLTLSTGEEYRVSSGNFSVKKKKLKNFIFRKTDEKSCLVIHKNGLSEYLSLRKLKRIINATLGFKSMKTAYATIKGVEVMRALRKGQAESFYFGHPLGEMRLVSRVFER
jgi:hypothetical protein